MRIPVVLLIGTITVGVIAYDRMDRQFQHCSLALYRLAGAIVDDQACSILTSSSWIKTGNGIQLTLRVDFMVYS